MKFSVMGIGIVLRVCTQLVILVVSSRYFSPAEIGIAATIYALYHLIWPWFEVAIGQTYYQIENKDTIRLESLSLLIILSCIFAAFITLGLSATFEKLTSGSGMWVAVMLSSAVVLRSLSLLSSADLLKTLRIKLFTVIEQGSFIAGHSIALILCVVFDFGMLYLIVGMFLYSLISSLMFLMCNFLYTPFKYHGPVTFAVLMQTGGYFIASGLNTFIREANILLIGLLVSTTSAGFYSRAVQIYLLGAFTIGQVFDKLLTPIFRKNILDKRNNAEVFSLSTLILVAWLIPASVFLMLNAKSLILLLFGERWLETAPTLRILALVLAFRTCSKINEAALRAYGFIWLRVAYYLLWACILLIGAYPAASIGLTGFAWLECLGAIIFWGLSGKSASRLVGSSKLSLTLMFASCIPTIFIFISFHYGMIYLLKPSLVMQIGLEVIIIIFLGLLQILCVTKVRYSNLNILRQFL